MAAKITGDLYVLPVPGQAPLLGVLCSNLKDPPFPDAALIMREVCHTEHQPIRQDWDQSTASHSMAPDRLQVLAALLRSLDGVDYGFWNFDVCTVESGPFKGICAVGIGSNKKKRERAGNLALALTVARDSPRPLDIRQAGSAFLLLASKVRDFVFEPMSAAPPPPPPPPPSRSTALLCGSSCEANVTSSANKADDPPSSSSMMRSSRESTIPCAHVLRNLDEPNVSARTQSTTDITSSGSMVKSPREPMTTSGACVREASVASDLSEEVVYTSCAPQGTSTSNAAAWLGPEPQEQGSWEPFEGDIGGCLPDDPGHGKGVPVCYGHAAKEPLAPDAMLPTLGGKGASCTRAFTIATLGTADTIPLGTDLDPSNKYNNLWAANRIKDPVGQKLFTHNIGRRVLDAENLGFTYGQRVLHQRRFDIAGVKKAVAYFLREGLDEVIVVGKRTVMREELAEEINSGRCQLLIADDSDDVFVLKKAFECKCPIVSRDNYRAQKEDLRIDPEIRRWCRDVGEQLQVKFTFDQHGAFVVDYDHHMPVLRPCSGQRWPTN